MYQPVLSRFQSLDPISSNGVDLLDDNNWFGDRLTRMTTLYGYAHSNPVNYVDPSGLIACNGEEKDEKVECSGACFYGNKTKITKCAFEKIKVEKGSGLACYGITSALICFQLTSQFEANNKAAEDLVKFPKGDWLTAKCREGCECKKGFKLKKGPQKFVLKDRTIRSTGPIFGRETTCILTVSGTVEVDGNGFALVECKYPNDPTGATMKIHYSVTAVRVLCGVVVFLCIAETTFAAPPTEFVPTQDFIIAAAEAGVKDLLQDFELSEPLDKGLMIVALQGQVRGPSVLSIVLIQVGNENTNKTHQKALGDQFTVRMTKLTSSAVAKPIAYISLSMHIDGRTSVEDRVVVWDGSKWNDIPKEQSLRLGESDKKK